MVTALLPFSIGNLMSSFDEKILATLRIMAEDVTPVNSSRIAAAIVLDKNIVSFGVNSRKTDTWAFYYSKHPEAICVHAEVAAIKNAVKRVGISVLENSTLYIARRKKSNDIWVDGNCCPCAGCQKAIKHFKIKKVIYTND